MNTLLQDFRFGLRMLYKNALTSMLVILALGIGIGANTTIFSLMYSIMFMPMPIIDPDRIVRILEIPGEFDGNDNISPQNFLEWKEQCKSLEGIFLIGTEYKNLSGYGEPVRIPAHIATNEFFTHQSAGDMPMALGRTFLEEEFRPGNSRVAILNHGFWKEQFGSDPSVLNNPILLDGEPYTIVGVLSTEMDLFESETRMWLPFSDDKFPEDRNVRNYASIGWLKEGYTIEQAQQEMKQIYSALKMEYPEANKDYDILVEPVLYRLYDFIEQTFIVLYGAAGFVLLIVCSNVASLMLARGNTRQKEISIRVAMGAGRLQIIRQLLTESMVLSLAGGVVGVLISVWGIEYLNSMVPTGLQSFLTTRGIDMGMLIFTFSLSIVCGFIFGIVPAWQTSRANLNDNLKEGGRSTGNQSGKQRLLKTLVVGEVALALVLLIGAGLMVNSFIRLQNVEPGFRNTNAITGHVYLDDNRYAEVHQKRAFYTDISRRLQGIPGVESAGITNVAPVTWGESIAYEIDGQEPLSSGENRWVQRRHISSSYFESVGIPILLGRDFTLADEQEDNHKIIVNQEFAEKNFGEENPLGKYVRISEWSEHPFEIVGMVGNIRHFGFNENFSEEIYIPYYTQPARHISFAVTTNQPQLEKIISSIRKEFWAIDPNLPVVSVRTIDDLLSENVRFQRLGVVFLSGFSVIALLLSSMGVFGIMSYTVSRQTHDIGVRMALGAQSNKVVYMVLKQGLTLTLWGLGIGIILSYGLKRVLESQLYGITASDPTTYIAISLILIVISVVACIIPARHASKVDPLTALRYE